MKLRQAAILSYLAASASAFSVLPRVTTTRCSTCSSRLEVSAVAVDPDLVDVYEQLGIEQGKLALGVKSSEVMQYIGTREDLITKTLADIPAFDRSQAEAEIDKFLMDAEMMNMYIQYGKEVERDPNFVVPDNEEDEGLFSVKNVVFAYGGYVAVTALPTIFRRYVAEQEIAGLWKPTNIQFLDDWIEKTSPEATARVLQKAAEVAGDSVAQVASDIAADTTLQIAVVADAVVQAGQLLHP